MGPCCASTHSQSTPEAATASQMAGEPEAHMMPKLVSAYSSSSSSRDNGSRGVTDCDTGSWWHRPAAC
jgi:hypothetical protein